MGNLPATLGGDLQLNFDALNIRLNAAEARTLSGSGSPEEAVKAKVGVLYLRSDGGAGTTLYVKESGDGTDEGWVAK